MARPFFLFVCMVTISSLIQNIQGSTEYDTYFHIYTKENIDKPISMIWTNTDKWSKEKSLKTCTIKLLAHGYAERWNMDWRWDWVAEMKNEILSNKTKGNICVMAIDWEKGARHPNYIRAVGNADVAGEHIAEFIRNNHIDAKRLHCIGFSLGAHVCAFASKNYYIITKKTTKFARITGLDPAGPLLRKASIDKRLSPDDADFVDCIHTSATFGLQEKSGHMDFFPEGGKSSAKGCEKLITIEDENEDEIEKPSRIKRFFFSHKDKEEKDKQEKDKQEKDKEETNDEIPQKGFIEKLRDRLGKLTPLKKVFLNVHAYIGCNHLRSPHYFISSINQCQFRAKLCSSWTDYLAKKCQDSIDNDLTYPRMGFHADQSDRIYQEGNGSFYLRTISEKPYCSLSSLPEQKSKKKTSKLKKKLSKILPQRIG